MGSKSLAASDCRGIAGIRSGLWGTRELARLAELAENRCSLATAF